MTLKPGRDLNGNKTLKVSFGKGQKFSVQTLGNLQETHEMRQGCFRASIAERELRTYVGKYGTKRQKELLGE